MLALNARHASIELSGECNITQSNWTLQQWYAYDTVLAKYAPIRSYTYVQKGLGYLIKKLRWNDDER